MTTPTRRQFLAQAGSCAAHLSAAAVLLPSLRTRWPGPALGRVVAAEPFARLEQVAEGVWALISTPLGGDFTTICNGGLIAGRNGVLAIEGFGSAAGATWLATKSRELTGKWPSHVVVTHYHSDHTEGVAGYRGSSDAPMVHATETTRTWVKDKNKAGNAARDQALADAMLIDPAASSTLDLGGRTVRIVPRAGHTASDVSLELDEPGVVFAGDLVWNGMFPNYVNAVPSQLDRTVRAIRKDGNVRYVPGHGPMAEAADVDRYLAMLGEVERAARQAHQRGQTAAVGAAEYAVPASFGEWTLFSKQFIEVAFAAWYRELGG